MTQILYFFDDCYSVDDAPDKEPTWDIVWGQWVRLPVWKRYKIVNIWRRS